MVEAEVVAAAEGDHGEPVETEAHGANTEQNDTPHPQDNSVAQWPADGGQDDDAPLAHANGFHVDTAASSPEAADDSVRDGNAPHPAEDDERVSN
ncbi:hypothetical protein D3C72_1986910 [compost metagenome]